MSNRIARQNTSRRFPGINPDDLYSVIKKKQICKKERMMKMISMQESSDKLLEMFKSQELRFYYDYYARSLRETVRDV